MRVAVKKGKKQVKVKERKYGEGKKNDNKEKKSEYVEENVKIMKEK